MLFVLYWCLSILILGSPFHWINASDQTFAICADQKGFIRCEGGTKIKIVSAMYGRTDDKVCPYGDTNSRSCRSLTSEMKVRWSCNGYRTCHLHASNHIFGDPCHNVSKYLEVKYRCIIKEDQDTCVKGKQIIAFNAYVAKDMTFHRNTPVNIVYDTLYFNYGNAYNPRNGFFTAPSDGLYVFTWSSLVVANTIFDAAKGVGNCNNEGNPAHENCSNTLPLVLKTGDKVNIRSTNANFLRKYWSSFKGWKV